MNNELVYWIIAVWFAAMPIPCIVMLCGDYVRRAMARVLDRRWSRYKPTALRVEVIPGTANGYRINARGGESNVPNRRPS